MNAVCPVEKVRVELRLCAFFSRHFNLNFLAGLRDCTEAVFVSGGDRPEVRSHHVQVKSGVECQNGTAVEDSDRLFRGLKVGVKSQFETAS